MRRTWKTLEIRALAFERVLKPLWRRRKELAPGAVDSPLGLLPIKPDLVIKELLGLKLDEPDEIIPELDRDPLASSQIGGILDRELKRVVVAKNLPLQCRRFTMLHEAGHYLLHPDLVYHRDLPLNGSERMEVRGRPREEVEADAFAVEVLMPKRLVSDLFVARYGGAVSPDDIDEDLAFKLSLGTGRRLSIDALIYGFGRIDARRERSRIFASDTHAGTSFTDLLLVSKEAMAIRLEELNLVV